MWKRFFGRARPSLDESDLERGIKTDLEFDDCVSEQEGETERHKRMLDELEGIQIHKITNAFVGSNKLEKKYRRMRLRENAPLLRWVSALLLLCFLVDCISLAYRRGPNALYITMCSLVCFQLGLFLFRNRLYSHLLIHYYQYTTTMLGASAFAYVVLSDGLSGCVLFDSCTVEDTTRVAYGMSLLFAVLPFGFRISFAYIAVMYITALTIHVGLRSFTLVAVPQSDLRMVVLDSLLMDTLYLLTIMTIMLYGAYVYERNDRVVFLRMQKSTLQSDQLQSELRMVREELGFAEDEANTNELKLEIERAKSDLDRLYPGAQLELESWVMPFDALAIDRRVGEGSCGEVYRGRIRCSREHLTMFDAQRHATQSFSGFSSFTSIPQQHATGTFGYGGGNPSCPPSPSPLASPSHFSQFSQKFGDHVPMTPRQAHHRREFSTVPYNSIVAVKRIPKHKINRKVVLSLLQETLVMSKCRHPNVLRLIGLVYDPFVCVIFEYMALGSLKDLLDESNPCARSRRPTSRQQYESSGKLSSQHNHSKDLEDFFKDKDRNVQRESMIQSLTDFNVPNEASWTHTKTRMCVNVAAGVSYLHSQNILHRDLKSSNLMVDSTQAVKVADLGTARLIQPVQEEDSNDRSKRQQNGALKRRGSSAGSGPGHIRPRPLSRVGSPLWIAPEVISSEGQYNGQCDVWSFGVILCEVMTHRDPYTDQHGRSHFNLLNVVDGMLSPLDFIKDVEPNTPPAIIKLARDCCQFDPKRRCSMKQALFRLLQIAVEQETSKVEADAMARAGPYLRYSQPSRRNIFKRHGSSSVDLLDDTLVCSNVYSPGLRPMHEDSSYRSKYSSGSKLVVGSRYSGESPLPRRSFGGRVSEDECNDGNLDADDESLTDETDVDDDELMEPAFASQADLYQRSTNPATSATACQGMINHTEADVQLQKQSQADSQSQCRPMSTSTATTTVSYTTAISSPDSPRTWVTGDSFMEDRKDSMSLTNATPLLRKGYSTHTLGETVDMFKAQSLLSSFPSMGSMLNLKNHGDFLRKESFEDLLRKRSSSLSRESTASSAAVEPSRLQSKLFISSIDVPSRTASSPELRILNV